MAIQEPKTTVMKPKNGFLASWPLSKVKTVPSHGRIHENAVKKYISLPTYWTIPKRISGHAKMRKMSKNVNDNTQDTSTAWRKPTLWRMGEERWKHECMMEWEEFFGFLLAQEVKTRFSKMMASPIWIQPPYSSHPHALTNSTNFWKK